MKTVVFYFIFLAFALVLCHQDVHKPGAKKSLGPCVVSGADTDKALKNLIEDGKPIDGKLVTSFHCKVDMNKGRINTVQRQQSEEQVDFSHFNFQKTSTCFVVGQSANLMVSVISKLTGEKAPPGSEQCANVPAFQAVYLLQEPDRNSYMILKPGIAPWFFTAPLGGCDIFVAKARNMPRRPLVIHSNLDIHGDDRLKNLQLKGEAVDNLMLRPEYSDYKLIVRAYSAPPPGAVRQQAVAYFQRYKSTHQGIQIIPYDSHKPATKQSFQFIGHYNEDQNWIFIIKGEIDGRIIFQLQIPVI